MPIRLLLVDDHVLLGQSLSRLLGAEPDFKVIADCGIVAEALDVLRREAVNLVVLDFDLGPDPGTRPLEATRSAGSSAKVLIVTAGMTASAAALRRGASGIFLKQGPPGALAQAIRLIAGGAMWVDPHQDMADHVEDQEDRRDSSYESPWTIVREPAKSGMIFPAVHPFRHEVTARRCR